MNSAGIRFQDEGWITMPEYMAIVAAELAFVARAEAVAILVQQRNELAKIRKGKK